MEDALALLIIFGSSFGFAGFAVWVSYKKKQLQAAKGAAAKQLEKEKEERKQLEARIQNLESIVCSVDLELNARMNRMLAAQSAIGALPPHQPDASKLPATVARGSVLAMALQPGQKIAERYTIERE